jgi:Porin PorA
MRRVLGVTLTGLGAFFLVLGVMGHLVLPGLVVKFPLNEYSVSRLSGTDMSYFSPATGQEVNGATVRAVATTQGDVSAGSSSTAVWNNFTAVFDITQGGSPGTAISYSSERLAFNRRTGVLVNCCGAAIGTTRPHFSGQGFLWPIGTQQKTYQIYDTTLMKPEPVQFTGTTTIDGLKLDIFIEQINNQQFGSVTLPGSLVGSTQATVTLPEYETATNTYYVDPGTGSPVKIIEAESESLEDPSTGGTALVLLKGTLTTTPQTVAATASTASGYDTEIQWVQTIGPLLAILLGIVLLVVGILMITRGDEEEYEYEEDEAVGADA